MPVNTPIHPIATAHPPPCMRVCACAQLGYLQQARYLSSNSGGSWFNGAMSFGQVGLVCGCMETGTLRRGGRG